MDEMVGRAPGDDAGLVSARTIATYVPGEERPWVDSGRGSLKQVIRVDTDTGTWIVRDRFRPGYRAPRHRHTGCVHAFTASGRWRYQEYDFVAEPGSYVHEPANSVHTLEVVADAGDVTEVLFVVEGSLLILDDDGQVTSVVDGFTQADDYLRRCVAQGERAPTGLLV